MKIELNENEIEDIIIALRKVIVDIEITCEYYIENNIFELHFPEAHKTIEKLYKICEKLSKKNEPIGIFRELTDEQYDQGDLR